MEDLGGVEVAESGVMPGRKIEVLVEDERRAAGER
jgi:hypothetical protein